MHLSRVDLNLLVVFDTVLAEGSITAASRKLNLSQPAVSHALARLREMVGHALFERRGRGIAPTPLARSLAGPVRDALATMQRALAAGGAFDPHTARRRFRLGVRESLEPSVLPGLARTLHVIGPGLELVSARHGRARLAQELGAGEFDVALDVLLPAADQVPHERVRVDRLVVVARLGHPALRPLRGGVLDLDGYLALEHLQVSSRRRGPALEDVALQALGCARRVRMRCQSHAAACRIAADTNFVATLPQSHAEQHVDRARHRLLALPLEGCALETYMYWPENAAADPANRWLRDQVRAALRPQPPIRAARRPPARKLAR